MKKSLLLLTLALAFSLTGCANNKAKESVQDRVDQAKNVKPADLQANVRKAIQDSDMLSETQKQKLLAIDVALTANQDVIVKELNKSKVVLVDLVCQKNMNQKEYNTLKKKIVTLTNQKLQNGFEASLKVHKILFPKTEASLSQDEMDQKQRDMYYMIHRHNMREL